jgi:hypothetical protein
MLTLAWSRGGGKFSPNHIFAVAPEPSKIMRSSFVTFPEYAWATKRRLSSCFFAPEVPIWRPQTGSNETVSLHDSNY